MIVNIIRRKCRVGKCNFVATGQNPDAAFAALVRHRKAKHPKAEALDSERQGVLDLVASC